MSDPFEEAAVYLAGIEGIEMEESDQGKITLKGDVERASDVDKLKKFLSRYPDIKDETSLSPEAGEYLEGRLRRRLQELEPSARIQRRGRSFIVSGSPSSDVMQELRKIYPQIQTDESSSIAGRIEPTVFLEVALIEVKKSALSKLGLRVGSPLGVTGNLGLQFLQGAAKTASLIGDPLRGFLDLAMQKGEARVHAKQSVVTQNGRRGTFMAGGEFPIKVVSGIVAKVEFKNFGLILGFTPKLYRKNIVHLNIDSEMSDIDMGSMVDGIPVIFKKNIRTQIFAKLDEMMAIGGIVENRQAKMTDSIPGLSAIPGIGRLFESEDFKRHRSEAYIFITPKLMTQPWLPSPEL